MREVKPTLFRLLVAFGVALCCTLIVTSCATIVNGVHQSVSITATPPDATITIISPNRDTATGIGNMTAILKRGVHHTIEVKKDGYRTIRFITGNGTAGWYWGNDIPLVAYLSPLGIPIDLLSGAAYSIEPDHINISLEPAALPVEQRVIPDATEGIWQASALAVVELTLWAALIIALQGFGHM